MTIELDPEITQADLRHDAHRDYLHVIVEYDETEFERNFPTDATDDEILEDWHQNHKTWRII